MNFVDTHTHLYSTKFNDDQEQVVQSCITKGVNKLLLPNIDSTSTQPMLDLATKYPHNCFPMMGIHPCSINNESIEKELAHTKEHLFGGKTKFIAVGEIGIDLYWDKTTLQAQVKAFKQQIQWAKELDLPIAIHARDSFDEIFEVLDEVNDTKLRGVLHCFTGNLEQAKKVISYGGFKLGIGGVVTFKNGGLDKFLKEIDLQHILLETDAPYLAPTPYRGKRNTSEYIPIIAEKLADIYGCSLPEIADITTQNAIDLFDLEK